jgi:general nucleoside transport system ATP-binding protein
VLWGILPVHMGLKLGTCMSTHPPLVELRDITKRFPGVIACDGVNFQVYAGEIHALLGENGAGKTTLMQILYGLHHPDTGEICIDGQQRLMRSPKDAMRAGIGMVFQHFTLIPSLTVTENIVLAAPGRGLLLRPKVVTALVQQLAERYQLEVDPDSQVWQLSVGEQQRVEILKLLHRRSRVLILDEPTAVLTPQENETFVQTMRTLAAAGHAVILITHKLTEALSVAHRITVLRHGRVVANPEPAEVTPSDLARWMIGRDLPAPPTRASQAAAAVELSLAKVSAQDDRGLWALRRVSLEVRRGEILGIAGVAGNGQRELAEVIVGLRRALAGTVHISGADMTNASPQAIIGYGVSYVPEDRQGMGLVPSAGILDNLLLKAYRVPPLARGPFLNYTQAADAARRLLSTFAIHVPRLDAPASVLSGGNQQRLLLGRELSLPPSLLIACSPTRGLDVSAVEIIHRLLLEQRQRGCAILLISEDLDELIALADRIAVIYGGEIVGCFGTDATDVVTLGLMMAGGRRGRL